MIWSHWTLSIANLLVTLQTINFGLCAAAIERQPLTNLDTKSSCSIFNYVGVNDLSINDIVVKSSASNLACIKARFSLAIKVEALVEPPSTTENPTNNQSNGNDSQAASNNQSRSYGPSRIVLGYLPLDSVVNVEDSCPHDEPAPATQQNKEDKTSKDEPHELDMIVSFECGKLAFSFKREDSIYLTAIKGYVKLDSNTMREFIAEKPMFFTSDLVHHFKFSDLIEVEATVKTKAFILTADFYHLEFEAFRNTVSRDFIRPPDDHSRPFL